MYREILNLLSEWKETSKKPLLLMGEKGVGKSYALRDFGEGYFDSVIIMDFKTQQNYRYLLDRNLNISDIERLLEISNGGEYERINTLLIFENIDFLKDGNRAVRFLIDNISDYRMAFTISTDEENYVDKEIIHELEVMTLYPMSFNEFLIANKESKLADKIEKEDKEALSDEDVELIEKYLQIYVFVGGMPEIADIYVRTNDMNIVYNQKKNLLNSILEEFENIEDILLKENVIELWERISMQNEKVEYSLTDNKRYSEAVEWLLYNKYIAIEHMKNGHRKLFYNDIGILTGILDLTYEDIDLEKLFTSDSNIIIKQLIFEELRRNSNINETFLKVTI